MANVDARQHMNHQCPCCTNKRLLLTQLAVNSCSSCGSLLGHSQEWGDLRPGHGVQSCPQALALPIMQSQLANRDILQSPQKDWVSKVLK